MDPRITISHKGTLKLNAAVSMSFTPFHHVQRVYRNKAIVFINAGCTCCRKNKLYERCKKLPYSFLQQFQPQCHGKEGAMAA
jgi:hypothetical protein